METARCLTLSCLLIFSGCTKTSTPQPKPMTAIPSLSMRAALMPPSPTGPTPMVGNTFNIGLAWDHSPSPAVIGYKIYWGPAPRTYTNSITTGYTNSTTVSNLLLNTFYFFTATAFDSNRLESDWSNEVSWPPTNKIIMVVAQQSTNINGPWTLATNWPAVYYTNPACNLFLKLAVTNWSQ